MYAVVSLSYGGVGFRGVLSHKVLLKFDSTAACFSAE